jgi:hypothetical protein
VITSRRPRPHQLLSIAAITTSNGRNPVIQQSRNQQLQSPALEPAKSPPDQPCWCLSRLITSQTPPESPTPPHRQLALLGASGKYTISRSPDRRRSWIALFIYISPQASASRSLASSGSSQSIRVPSTFFSASSPQPQRHLETRDD